MLHVLTTAEQVGANVALEKPFDIADLLANVNHLVASRGNDDCGAVQA